MCCFLVGWEAFCFQQKGTVRCSFRPRPRKSLFESWKQRPKWSLSPLRPLSTHKLSCDVVAILCIPTLATDDPRRIASLRPISPETFANKVWQSHLHQEKGGHGTLAPWRFGWNTSFYYFFSKTLPCFFVPTHVAFESQDRNCPLGKAEKCRSCCGQDLNNQLI